MAVTWSQYKATVNGWIAQGGVKSGQADQARDAIGSYLQSLTGIDGAEIAAAALKVKSAEFMGQDADVTSLYNKTLPAQKVLTAASSLVAKNVGSNATDQQVRQESQRIAAGLSEAFDKHPGLRDSLRSKLASRDISIPEAREIITHVFENRNASAAQLTAVINNDVARYTAPSQARQPSAPTGGTSGGSGGGTRRELREAPAATPPAAASSAATPQVPESPAAVTPTSAARQASVSDTAGLTLPDHMDAGTYGGMIAVLGKTLGEYYPDLKNTNALSGFTDRAIKPEVMNTFINKYNSDPALREQLKGVLSDMKMAETGGGLMGTIGKFFGGGGDGKDPKKIAADAMRSDIQIMLEHPDRLSNAGFIEGLRTSAKDALEREYPILRQGREMMEGAMGFFRQMGEALKYVFKGLHLDTLFTGNAGGGLLGNLMGNIGSAFASAGQRQDLDLYVKNATHVEIGPDGKEKGRFAVTRNAEGKIERTPVDDSGNPIKPKEQQPAPAQLAENTPPRQEAPDPNKGVQQPIPPTGALA